MGPRQKTTMLLALVGLFCVFNFISPMSFPYPKDSPNASKPNQVSDLPGQDSADDSIGSQHGLPEASNLSKKTLNILLLGVDARAKEASRTDSIMLVSLNPTTNKATVISVLRDTYVTIPTATKPKNRINSAYTLGGPSLTVKTVSKLLQVPINYYVVADFQAFEKAVDVLGGVEVDVEKAMDYQDDGVHDIHLKPGLQNLNGNQALGYARFRHDPRGDFARVERQRKLFQAILKKVQGVQAFYYLPKLFEVMQPYIKTNLDFSTAAGLIYQGCQVKQVEAHTVPNNSDFKMETIDGMAVLVPNVQHLRTDVKKLLP